jgi:hypothetical protein
VPNRDDCFVVEKDAEVADEQRFPESGIVDGSDDNERMLGELVDLRSLVGRQCIFKGKSVQGNDAFGP